MLRALLRQLGARVSRQPNDPPPVRLSCFSRGVWLAATHLTRGVEYLYHLSAHVAEVHSC